MKSMYNEKWFSGRVDNFNYFIKSLAIADKLCEQIKIGRLRTPRLIDKQINAIVIKWTDK